MFYFTLRWLSHYKGDGPAAAARGAHAVVDHLRSADQLLDAPLMLFHIKKESDEASRI
jgi:hypothetical protein